MPVLIAMLRAAVRVRGQEGVRMLKNAVCAFAVIVAALSSASAQSTSDLLKIHDSLNDMCRDGVGDKTGEACEARDLLGQLLKARNICFGQLGKTKRCRPDGSKSVRAGSGSSRSPIDEPGSTRGSCRLFAENEIIEAKGFIVQFDYAAEETKPKKVYAIALDKPICFEKDQQDRLKLVILDVQSTSLLGRHGMVEMRMIAGEAWSGSVQAIQPNDQIE